ncbi:MAG: hypothetical protein ACC660_05185 [Acidimicrobiales bacterium]
MGRNLPNWGRFLASIVIITLVVVMNPPPAAEVAGGDQEPADVLGQIEVWGQQLNLSDGRTASYAAAASGLSPRGRAPTPTEAVVRIRSVAERGAAALATISYPWEDRLPGWVIDFSSGESGPRGLTYTLQQRIEVFVRDGDSQLDLARVAAHEIGHAVDLVYNDEQTDRQRWFDQRGVDLQTRWWPDSGAADFASGAGDFAECFATWQTGSSSLSRLAGPCSVSDLELLGALS